MTELATAWAGAFLWTLALELPVYWLLLRKRVPHWRSCILIVLGLNLLTHPALWFCVPRFEPITRWFLLVETGVVIVEAAALLAALRFVAPDGRHLRREDVGVASVAALLANCTSGLVGLLLF